MASDTVKSTKKLIEVSLPLDDINAAASRRNPSVTDIQVLNFIGLTNYRGAGRNFYIFRLLFLIASFTL